MFAGSGAKIVDNNTMFDIDVSNFEYYTSLSVNVKIVLLSWLTHKHCVSSASHIRPSCCAFNKVAALQLCESQ